MSVGAFGPGGLDYFPCRYGPSRQVFRGPPRDLNVPYVAFLGDTNTYGKFIERPFPDLVENELGISCVNLGCMNAGIDAITCDPEIVKLAHNAVASVFQITSPRNMSNPFYKVHPRRNDRFLKPTSRLKALYPEVDFSEFSFTKHMMRRLYKVCPERFYALVDELQDSWEARMEHILAGNASPTVLLWFSDHAPGEPLEAFGFDPWFVPRALLTSLQAKAARYVEVIASDEAMAAGTEGMFFSELETDAARHVLGPFAHREAAAALVPVLKELIETEAHPGRWASSA